MKSNQNAIFWLQKYSVIIRAGFEVLTLSEGGGCLPPQPLTRDLSLDPFSGLCPEPHIAMGRGKQSLTAPLQGECPGQRGCKGLPDRRRSAYCPFTPNHVTGRDQGGTQSKGGRRPFILTLDGEGADTLNPAGGGYRPPLAPFRAGG